MGAQSKRKRSRSVEQKHDSRLKPSNSKNANKKIIQNIVETENENGKDVETSVHDDVVDNDDDDHRQEINVSNEIKENNEEEEDDDSADSDEENQNEIVGNIERDVDDNDIVEGVEKENNKLQQNASGKSVRKVIVVLEEACLEAVKSSKGSFELLNCDDHLYLHKKLNKNPVDSRPDITHQCLLTLLDSPLNKAGYLQVYIRTKSNVLISISPHLRIPRTYKRFSGLIVQLLHKMKIAAVNKGSINEGGAQENGEKVKKTEGKVLMKVIKNPVTRHLPIGALIFGTSVTGELVDVHEFAWELKDDRPVVFVFGAFAHGHLEPNYAEKMLSFSEYPLSAACAISRMLNAFERKWHIL